MYELGVYMFGFGCGGIAGAAIVLSLWLGPKPAEKKADRNGKGFGV